METGRGDAAAAAWMYRRDETPRPRRGRSVETGARLRYQRAVKDRVAAFRGVGRDNVFVGVGSDEAIDLLFRVFCEPRLANVVVAAPRGHSVEMSRGVRRG